MRKVKIEVYLKNHGYVCSHSMNLVDGLLTQIAHEANNQNKFFSVPVESEQKNTYRMILKEEINEIKITTWE